MLRTFSLASAMILAVAGPALADASSCYEPIAPAAVDGSTASEAQVKALSQRSRISSNHPMTIRPVSCLIWSSKSAKRQSRKTRTSRKSNPSVQADVSARIDKNQKLKEQVGNEYNAAVKAYQAAHPAPAAAH